MQDVNNPNSNPKKSNGNQLLHGCAVLFLVIIVIVAITVPLARCLKDDTGSTSSLHGSVSDRPLRREANNGDITVDGELDFSSLGEKIIIFPQVDIDDLEITLKLYDDNNKLLTTRVKYFGNVKKGVSVEFSISIVDLGLSVSWNARKTSIEVTGGTVSYFA